MPVLTRQIGLEPIPPELDRWSWGAFLLNWVWGVGNNTYIALLTFVPFFGILIMPFVLGAKGNAWAWRNGRWDSVARFKRVQRLWAIWGAVVVVGYLAFIGIFFGGFWYGFSHSEVYQIGVSKLQTNAEAVSVLGAPIAAGFPLGNISINGATGQAELAFTATGSKASDRIYLEAVKKDGAWVIRKLMLTVPGRERAIDLLSEMKAMMDCGPSVSG